MPDPFTRRDFLKTAGLGLTVSAALTGLGPLARGLRRNPYSESPGPTATRANARLATTCCVCPAGCGLLVHTLKGHIYKVEGNPLQPLNRGAICSAGRDSWQALYSPYRTRGPGRKVPDGSGFLPMGWESALRVVRDALEVYQPGEIAFLLGLTPDHLFDLVQILSAALGGANVLRYEALSELEGRVTLIDAARRVFGMAKAPHFDVERSEVIFSFGADFSESWLSPLTRMMSRQCAGGRGYLVQFEPRRSWMATQADEWIPIEPGSDNLLAWGLGRLVAEFASNADPGTFAGVNLSQVVEGTGVPEDELKRLACLFVAAPRKVALPGGIALGHADGPAAAEAILALNALADNLGREGGVFLSPVLPVHPHLRQRPNTIAEVGALVERLQSGRIKALFVHGSNPLNDLPEVYGFRQALQKLELMVSFSSTLDETAMQADFLLPDHAPLESWGYQRVVAGGNRLMLSGLQPVVAPLYDTRATANVLLGAVGAIGGDLAAAVGYHDELDFLRKSIAALRDQGGVYEALDMGAFWALWGRHGGWWKASHGLLPPVAKTPLKARSGSGGSGWPGKGEVCRYRLLPFSHPGPDEEITTQRPAWLGGSDLWVELNPETAGEIGVRDGQVVRIISTAGEIEALVRECSTIRPGAVGVPLGWKKRSFGGKDERLGNTLMALIGKAQNEAGHMAYMGLRVNVVPAERRRPLARPGG